MPRPTEQDLIHAASLLEELASRHHPRNNPNLWPDLYKLLDLAVWLDVDLHQAKIGAVHGPGSDPHTIGRHGLNRPVESRFAYPDVMTQANRGIILRDPLVKELLKLRAEWASQVGQLVDTMQQHARDAANWPAHTEQTG